MITKTDLINILKNPDNFIGDPMPTYDDVKIRYVKANGLLTRHKCRDIIVNTYYEGKTLLCAFDFTESNFIIFQEPHGEQKRAMNAIIKTVNPDRVLYLYPRKDGVAIYNLSATRIDRTTSAEDYPHLIDQGYCTILTDYHTAGQIY